MKRDEILALSSMPAASPSYPRGPYRFIDREYFIVIYKSDRAAVRAAVPEPLEPVDDLVFCEWIRMPDSSGFGDYTESGIVIPCTYQGKPINFTAQMYLDDDPPIVAGREIWGFPKKYAEPKLEVVKDTLTGTLHYAGQLVAMGTMVYKHDDQARDGGKTLQSMQKTQCNLKIIPGVDGKRERFDRRQVQLRHLLSQPPLLLERLQVVPARPVGQVHRRRSQQQARQQPRLVHVGEPTCRRRAAR